MKKTLSIIMLAVLIACSNAPQEVKVGVTLPQTGISAALGKQMLQGLELAANETGNPLTLVIEDDACDAKAGVTATQKLLEVDNVDAIIGPICTVAILSSAEMVEEAKVPRITTGMVLQKTANAGPYHFSFLVEMKHQMRAIASYAKAHSIKSLGAIAINDDLGKESIAELKSALQEEGISVSAEEYFEKPETDFKTHIEKVQSKSPNAIYLMGYAPNLVGIIKQSHELGITVPLLTWNLFQDPSIIKGLGVLAENVTYTFPEDPRNLPIKSAFKEHFRQVYGVEPGLYAANAYDSYMILARAVQKCQNDKECLKNELGNVRNFEGANGFITVDERGVGQRSEVSLKTVADGKFVTIS